MLDKVKSTTRSATELARLRAKLDYWAKKSRVKLPKDVVLLFLPEFMATITVENPKDVRLGKQVRTPVYRVGIFAKMLNKSPQTIRLWERDGILPDSGLSLVGRERGRRKYGQRCYTYAQLRAVFDLLPLLEYGDSRGKNEYTPFSRELWRRWMCLPDGIMPEYDADSEPLSDQPAVREPEAPLKLKGKVRRRQARS